MTMTNSEVPYFLRISWVDNGESKEQILDTRAASMLLYNLEQKKGIKAKFQFVE